MSLASHHPTNKEAIIQNVTPRRVVYSILALIIFLALCVGGAAGCKSYSRYQKRADANNGVKVTHINIKRAQQQAAIVRAQNAAVRARADQRAIEADGIRRAQDKISKTLTPLYVQHEAIKAIDNTGATTVYIPSGPSGVPLVNDIGRQATAGR